FYLFIQRIKKFLKKKPFYSNNYINLHKYSIKLSQNYFNLISKTTPKSSKISNKLSSKLSSNSDHLLNYKYDAINNNNNDNNINNNNNNNNNNIKDKLITPHLELLTPKESSQLNNHYNFNDTITYQEDLLNDF